MVWLCHLGYQWLAERYKSPRGEFPCNSSKDEVDGGLFSENRSLNSNLLRHHANLDNLKFDKVNPTISITDWLSSCKLGHKLLRVGIVPSHWIYSAVCVEILILVTVTKQD